MCKCPSKPLPSVILGTYPRTGNFSSAGDSPFNLLRSVRCLLDECTPPLPGHAPFSRVLVLAVKFRRQCQRDHLAFISSVCLVYLLRPHFCNRPVSLEGISFRSHVLGLGFFFYLIGDFRQFTFTLTSDMVGFKPTVLFSICSVCSFSAVFFFLSSLGLVEF